MGLRDREVVLQANKPECRQDLRRRPFEVKATSARGNFVLCCQKELKSSTVKLSDLTEVELERPSGLHDGQHRRLQLVCGEHRQLTLDGIGRAHGITNFDTTSISCGGMKGLTIQALAPAALPLAILSWPASVVSITTGVYL